MGNEVVITGIGLVTSLGIGIDANWRALTGDGAPVVNATSLPPYIFHPAPEIDWSEQIPKRGDQRQMELWQRLGVYAAGLALDDAGIKGDEALTGSMDMIAAASGGERDLDVDTMILAEAAGGRNDLAVLVNEKLSTELRPTLFLAQLSNLLAGNISIVHKVTGSSRTFMGEEGAGMSAISTACARIRSGQCTHMLAGGAHNGEHPDVLLTYELKQHLLRGEWAPVYERAGAEGGGVVPGSGGAFLVLESRDHAEQRGASVYAGITTVEADSGPDDDIGARLKRLAERTGAADTDLIISGCSGAKARTEAELDFIAAHLKDKPLRAPGSMLGHFRDAQFLMDVTVAALSLHHGAAIAAKSPDLEQPLGEPPKSIGVMTIGFESAEAMAHLHAVEPEQ